MGLLRNLFARKGQNTESQPAAQDSIAPTQFRKEEFSFSAFKDLDGSEAAKRVEGGDLQVLDVRFEYEYHHHHIPGARLIPLPQLPSHYQELDPAKPTLVVCEHGMRSIRACSFLSSKGFRILYNLAGGMSLYPGRREGTGVTG